MERSGGQCGSILWMRVARRRKRREEGRWEGGVKWWFG